MKISYLFPVLVASTLSLTGCASWINEIKSNPAAFVQQLEADTNIVVAGLTLSFNQVIVLLPADKQAKFQADWTAAVTALNSSEAALNLIINAAQQVGNSNPDITVLVTDVVNAVIQIENVITQVKAIVNASPTPATTAAASKLQTNADALYAVYVKTYPQLATHFKK